MNDGIVELFEYNLWATAALIDGCREAPAELLEARVAGVPDTVAALFTHLVGGHSIDDDTLKFGLSVTGFVNPHHVWTNAGARPGDHLILTKALGTGTMTAGVKRQRLREEDIITALDSMSTINNAIDAISMEERCIGFQAGYSNAEVYVYKGQTARMHKIACYNA